MGELAEEAFIGVCGSPTAKLPADATTDTLLNGRGWNFFNTVSWGSETKVYYVLGLADAFAVSERKPTLCTEYTGNKIQDLVQEFNRLYQDSANLRIPMAYLYPFVSSRLKGTCADGQLQTIVEGLRHWNAPAENTPATGR